MTIGSLPKDTLSAALSFLAKQDIGNGAQVNKQFHSAASESDIVWKAVAHGIYGEELAESTLCEYNGNWKEMVKDDNRLGACPTLYNIETCAWKSNGIATARFGAAHYYCTISCVKWDRRKKIVRVYIDVRGEADLRAPLQSGIRLGSDNGCSQIDNRGWDFVSEAKDERPGHYKGYIIYNESSFEPPFSDSGKCTFCYANTMQGDWADYETVKLFSFSPGNKLRDFFKNEEGCFEYSSFRSPYADDTELKEVERWSFVDSAVLKRRFPREWWV